MGGGSHVATLYSRLQLSLGLDMEIVSRHGIAGSQQSWHTTGLGRAATGLGRAHDKAWARTRQGTTCATMIVTTGGWRTTRILCRDRLHTVVK